MVLPTFLLVGAQKSGTTSLIHDLVQHPEIGGPADEVHYFDRQLDRGPDWYATNFPSGARATGETSPEYLFDPEVPARVHELVPEVQLLAILRNPIDRAYSHYWHNRTRGHERLSFADALAAEPERTATATSTQVAGRFAYAARGRYAEQLDRYLALFPRSQLLVVATERFSRERAAVLGEVYRFLGVDPSVVPARVGVQNPYVEFRSERLRRPIRSLPGPLRKVAGRLNVRKATAYPPMDPAVRERLRAELADQVRALASIADVGSAWTDFAP